MARLPLYILYQQVWIILEWDQSINAIYIGSNTIK